MKKMSTLVLLRVGSSLSKTGSIKKAEKNMEKAVKYSWSNEKKTCYEKALNKLAKRDVN